MADHEFGPAPPVREPRSDQVQPPQAAGPGSSLPRRTSGGLPAQPSDEDGSLPTRTFDGSGALPTRLPGTGEPLPARMPSPGAGLPTRTPGPGSGLPSRAPGTGGTLPSRSAVSNSGLPVRTTRTRRAGRHSSPHQLSLPSDAPALVIAVPGEATPENQDVVAEIAQMAASSCQGAEVRVGFLHGGGDLLEDALYGLRSEGPAPAAVVIPLIAFPDPAVTRAISGTVAASGLRILVSAPLGPHPLLGEVAHVRLAEAGLARASRAGRISIVTAAEGMIVGAAGGAEAVQAAGVVAVLLASRLAIPVVPASLTDRESLREAVGRLYDARVARVALAPCVIGPEIPPSRLASISAETGMACAPPLGSHPAIGQLVAIRYGGALADPKLAGLVT
jgi:sirohydrochlorin ferrochelatase